MILGLANFVFSCSFPPCEVFRKHWRMADSALLGLPPIAHFKQSQGVARCEPEASGKMSGSGLLSRIRRASSLFGNSALNAPGFVEMRSTRCGRSEGQSFSDAGVVGYSGRWQNAAPFGEVGNQTNGEVFQTRLRRRQVRCVGGRVCLPSSAIIK
jgi:hypothetical protein